MKVTRACWGALLLGLLLLGGPAAAERPDPPPFYAIRDAAVTTGTGETLERATVLIADGLIEAVGRDLEIPADAWVLDGRGLRVYPGLIDALTHLGQVPSEEPRSRPGGFGPPGMPGGMPGASRPQVRGPEDRPQTTPWRSAADLLSEEDQRVEKWREAGFTAAVTAPEDGFFAGQAALIALGDDEPRERVLATPVAQRLNFSGSGSAGMAAFPGSLMGRLSYVKQVLSDARHYGREERLYRESPQGRRRPEYDRTLAPIRDAAEGGLPFLMPADLGREIDRALDIAGEYDLRPILYGGRGAYERLERLRHRPVPVLVSLDWPEEERDRDPEAVTPLATLYHRRMAPATPQLLAAAGIPFAFTSDGLPTPAKAFESVRQAIAAGLSEAAALEALTVGPARIFGVDDRLGSIEAGKIANLVLATAAPWAEDVEIKAVFVDGRKYQLWEPAEPSEPPSSDVTGVWELTLHSPRGEREITAELEMSADGKVSGEMSSERGTRTVEKGRMSGDLLSFKTTQAMGERTMTASFSFTVTGETIEGTMSAGPMVMDLLGERTSKEVAAKGEDADEPAVALAELEAAMALYRGPVREYDRVAITNARVYTVTGETIENGTVLVEGGKIRAVGTDVRIPAKAETIDAGGGALIPGILDAHSHIAIEGGVNEAALAVSSMVTIEDVINPDDVAIYRALAGGVTTINALHGSANPIGGGSAVLKLRWGRDAAGLRFAGAPSNLKMALGENPKRSRTFPGMSARYPATRMGVLDVIRQAFSEAREYQKEWREHERAVKAGEKSLPPRVDFKLEPLVEVLTGERLVHAHCYRADEILQLLLLADELGFRIAALIHVLEGYKVADEIAAHGAGATTFSDWWGYKVEAYDAIPHNAALLTERGVVVSLKSDSAEEMRHLNQEAAKTMKWGGLDEIEALKLVTLNPAVQLGIEDRVGSIEVGKDADLVLYDGPPLAIGSVVQKTFIDGDLYFDREADRARQAAIDAIREKLEPEGEQGESRAPAAPAESKPQAPIPEEKTLSAASIVLEGGTIHTLVGEPTPGRVVIQGGLIRAVGPEAAVPEDAVRLEVTGLDVYPGMIDALGQLGLVEISSVAATVDTTELGSYNPQLRAITAIHPASELIPVTRANGITHALSAPRSGRDGVIPGQASLIHLDGWTAEEMAIDPALAMVIQWPGIRTRSFDFAPFSFRESSYKEVEERAEEAQNELRGWLEAARHYAQASGSGRTERDLKLEALARIFDGGQPVIIQADTRRDIEAAVAFASDEGLRMILAGGRDAWRVKELLAAAGIPVILGPTQRLPSEDDDAYDRPFRTAGELASAGVKIAFGSGAAGGFGPGGPHSARTLPYEAAMAAAYGLAPEEALKALTLYPAEILGIGDRLGSIEPGKIANLIITDGNPLEIATRVHHLIIDGRLVGTDNRHRSLYERYRARPRQEEAGH